MMPDREKVFSEFEDFVKSFSKRNDTYYKGLFVSVLALLKEQDKIIQNILLEKANELNDKVTTLQIEAQNREIRRLLEQK